MTYDSYTTSCYKTEENNCNIKIVFKNCELDAGANIVLQLNEKLSYTAAIAVNVTASSSIPGEVSSIYQRLIPATNSVFRGFNPTQFFYSMTPSYFRSQVDDWPSELVGYHVSVATNAIAGSQYLISE